LRSNNAWLPIVPQATGVIAKFELLRLDFEREMHSSYENWQQSFAKCGVNNLCLKLDRHLLVRGKQPKALLQCNIDATILELNQQAEHFERLSFAIPVPIRKIYERHETLRYVYNSVLQLCLNYNRIMNSLTDRERKLLRPLIMSCDRQLAPGICKMTFGAIVDPSDGYSQWLEDSMEHVEYLREIVEIYKRANRQIVRNCEKICDTIILRLSFTGAVDISVFEQQLSSWLNRGNISLRLHYNNIVEIMSAMAREFEDIKDEVSTC